MLIFEDHFEKFDAHVHITTKTKEYLEIFNSCIEDQDIFKTAYCLRYSK